MKRLMFSCTNVWCVISCRPAASSSARRQLAEEEQVGDLEERALLGELLDRVAAVAQDAPSPSMYVIALRVEAVLMKAGS